MESEECRAECLSFRFADSTEFMTNIPEEIMECKVERLFFSLVTGTDSQHKDIPEEIIKLSRALSKLSFRSANIYVI